MAHRIAIKVILCWFIFSFFSVGQLWWSIHSHQHKRCICNPFCTVCYVSAAHVMYSSLLPLPPKRPTVKSWTRRSPWEFGLAQTVKVCAAVVTVYVQTLLPVCDGNITHYLPGPVGKVEVLPTVKRWETATRCWRNCEIWQPRSFLFVFCALLKLK